MKNYERNLLARIEEMRQKMIEYADSYGLSDEKTLQMSRQLDELMNEYKIQVKKCKFIRDEYFYLVSFPTTFDHVHLFYIIIFICLVLSYFLCVPLIKFLVRWKSTRVLNYLMSSFLLVFTILTVTYFFSMSELVENLFQIVIHCLIIFGLMLMIRHLPGQIVKARR